MSEPVLNICVVKFGCIGISPLLDLIVDERAARKDIKVRTFASGAKLDPESCDEIMDDVIRIKPGLVLLTSPNASLPGPTNARQRLNSEGITTISFSDAPSKKTFYKKNEEGKLVENVADDQGFFVLTCDSMIGAKREFLDPTEMTLFNSDIIKVLSNTGVFRLVELEVERVITEMKENKIPELPRIMVTAGRAVRAANYSNPYAEAKAYAAFKIAETVSVLTTRACFKEKDPAKIIQLVTAGHELMRTAAILADEAREIEKYGDSLMRTPHFSTGDIKHKERLRDELE